MWPGCLFEYKADPPKEKLKIYWSPETEKKILEGLSLRNYHKDAALLAALKSI